MHWGGGWSLNNFSLWQVYIVKGNSVATANCEIEYQTEFEVKEMLVLVTCVRQSSVIMSAKWFVCGAYIPSNELFELLDFSITKFFLYTSSTGVFLSIFNWKESGFQQSTKPPLFWSWKPLPLIDHIFNFQWDKSWCPLLLHNIDLMINGTLMCGFIIYLPSHHRKQGRAKWIKRERKKS